MKSFSFNSMVLSKRTASGMFILLCILLLSSCGGSTINLWDYLIPAEKGKTIYREYYIEGDEAFYDDEDDDYEVVWEVVTSNYARIADEWGDEDIEATIEDKFIVFTNMWGLFGHEKLPLKVKAGKKYDKIFESDEEDDEDEEKTWEEKYAFFGPYSSKTFSIPHVTNRSRTDKDVIIQVEYFHNMENKEHHYRVTYYVKGKGMIGQHTYLDCMADMKMHPNQDYLANCDEESWARIAK